MNNTPLVRLACSIVGSAVCAFVALQFVGCDLGTYSERVQSNGGKLPVTPVSDGSDADSKDQSPAKSKAMARDSNDTALVSGSDGAKSGKKKLTSLSDIKNATDAKKLRESEAENRARAGNEN